MPPKEQPESDELLTNYLLRTLSTEEAELLDERSIADDDFSVRVDAAENDLVDAYVRGELSGETLERFEHVYLSSPNRLQKVEFSRALLQHERRSAGVTAAATRAIAIAIPKPQEELRMALSSSRWFQTRGFQWGLAAAAGFILFASGFLLVENIRLRKQQTQAQEQEIASAQRTRQLEKQLTEQLSTNAGLLKELEKLRESSPASQSLKTVAALLLPTTRGASQITRIVVPPGMGRVALRLKLETDAFPAYHASLKDLTTNRIIWQSADLKATSKGTPTEVSVTLAASLFKGGNYSIELSGVPAQGSEELLTSYPFKVVIK